MLFLITHAISRAIFSTIYTLFFSLVVKEDEPAENDYEDTDRDDFEKDNSFIGKGDGVLCRRDKVYL